MWVKWRDKEEDRKGEKERQQKRRTYLLLQTFYGWSAEKRSLSIRKWEK